MKCPLTGLECNEPKVFLINDNTKEYLLCEACAKSYLAVQVLEQNMDDLGKEISESLQKVVDGLFDIIEGKSVYEEKTEPIIDKCPNCKSTWADLKKSGRLGCLNCYDHFGPKILNILQKVQAGLQHTGKIPTKWLEAQAQMVQKEARKKFTINAYLKNLKETLNEVIKLERYEIAAQLRDKINNTTVLNKNYLELKKTLKALEDKEAKQKIREEMKLIVDTCFANWLQSTYENP